MAMYYVWGYALAGAFVAFILMYLDTKLLDHPKEKMDYLRGMFLVGFVIFLMGLFLGEDILSGQGRGDGGPGFGYIPAIQEEILTGAPNF